MTARRTSKRKAAPSQPAHRHDHPRRPAPVPDWFAAPTGPTAKRDVDIRPSYEHIGRMIEIMESGRLALPPWQRGDVWTEEQRICLLDSIMRGVGVGAVVCWVDSNWRTPSPGIRTVEPVGFCGVTPEQRPRDGFVIDGRQRLRTLLMAALGELDAWRWNGSEWTRRQGYITPSLAVQRPTSASARRHCELLEQACGEQTTTEIAREWEMVHYYKIQIITIEGSLADVVKTYERMATLGSAHSAADLEPMREWLARTE